MTLTSDDKLRLLAQECGIHLEYDGWSGHRQNCEPPTLRALLTALGHPGRYRRSDRRTRLHARQALVVGKASSRRTGGAGRMRLWTLRYRVSCEWHVVDADDNEVQAGRSDALISRCRHCQSGYFTLVVKGANWTEDVFILSRPAAAPDIATLTGNRNRAGGCRAHYMRCVRLQTAGWATIPIWQRPWLHWAEPGRNI